MGAEFANAARRARAERLCSEPPAASPGGDMRAWTVDADDIRVAEDFDESLLHRTPEIDSFLTADRDDKFIVIATKGFGKTLLLKAKRILYQRESRPGRLPTRNLLDKPIGDKIFGREALAFFAASPLPWSKSQKESPPLVQPRPARRMQHWRATGSRARGTACPSPSKMSVRWLASILDAGLMARAHFE